MKRFATLLTILALALPAFAQGQLDPLPADPRFDEPVEFSTGTSGESLPVMISALARAVGLTAITDDVLDKTIVYDIGDPKPFRQVWNIVLTLNELDYVLLENDVVVVGSPASVARLRQPAASQPEEADTAPVASELEQRFYRVNSDPDQVVGILRRTVAGAEIEALPGVNSVMVLGTAEQHERVRSVLDQFDTQEVQLEQRTYLLSNAVAADLAEVLTATGVLGQTEEGTSRIEDFTVVADNRTNSIIITGSAGVQARLAELIPQLDAPRQQINVNVRIQEVAHSVAYDLGLNINGSFDQFAASILDTGLSFVFNSAAPISAFNISAILDALETQGLSRRVDDGSITVLDNQLGSIQSGGTISIVVRNADGEGELIEIPYGVQIDVTPRVANDGSVTLQLEARVEDLAAPPTATNIHLTTRRVTSTVSLAPGQTALLGSLLQSNFTMTKSRVPILGAIPVIGELFTTTLSSDETTDLLLVVTAQVID